MIKPVIALFLAYQLVVDAQCTGCWIGTSGPCKQGTDFCGTPATPGPSSTPLPGSDCLDCSPPSSGKCKAPHDGVCHAEMPGNPENDNCPPDTTRCYPIIPEPTNPAPVTPAPTPATEVIFTEDFTDKPGHFGDVKINRNG